VLNDNINEISLQQDASFSVPTQIYYWHLHVSSFKKRSIFGNSDRHIHLLIRILLSNQVELNPGPQSLDESSYPCSICSQECTWDSDAIVCDNCDKWCHIGCVNINPSMYEKYENTSVGFAKYVIHLTILEQYFNHTYLQGIHFFVQTHIPC